MVETEPSTQLGVRTCRACGIVFEYRKIIVDGVEMFQPNICKPCQAIETERELAEMAEERIRTAVKAWETICPPLYRESDPARLGVDSMTLQQILTWQPNQTGIGLAGTSGTGKTRTMFMLLRRLHFDGVRIRATSAKRFEHWCHRMFDKDDDARTSITACRKVPVLFIDDIGKEKYTERVESEFYDLIEYRTSHLLPILWTANASGQQLARMMGEDRGTPIVRRLREFSTILSV